MNVSWHTSQVEEVQAGEELKSRMTPGFLDLNTRNEGVDLTELRAGLAEQGINRRDEGLGENFKGPSDVCAKK